MTALPMSEEQLERCVVDLCKLYGIYRYHTLRSKGSSSAGWPDEALCGDRGFLLRELKGSTGRVSTAQREWLERLRKAGQDADVWRPEDWRSGRIRRELEAIR